MAKRPQRPKEIDFRNKATLDYVQELAARGLYEKDIAIILGYDPKYMWELKQKFPGLSGALKAGVAHGAAFMTEKLFELAEARNPAAILFYLKAKLGWRDNDRSNPGGDEDSSNGTGDAALVQRVLDSVQTVIDGREARRRETNPD
jgi:hypothetical protein